MPTRHNNVLRQRLLTPGPTAVPPAVLLEMAQPIIHHRTKQFQEIFAQLSEKLQLVFRTASPVLTIAGSGTTAFEAAQVSLIQPRSKALTVAAGKFGERWQDIYDAYGHPQVKINVPWGQAVDPGQIDDALKSNPDVSVVTLVHSETSTATACNVKAIAQIVRQTDALLIVDGITAIGAIPVEMDAWDIDVLVTGSQKALMLPPGLGFVALGQRAIQRLQQVKPTGYYNLDLRRWLASWQNHDVPFTPPISLIRGQLVALKMIESQGLDQVWSHTANLASATRAAFQAMGLTLCSQSPSDSVTGAYYPDGVQDAPFRASLRDNHGILIAGGQNGRGDKWKGKVFRISHMGYVDVPDTLAALVAIETQLRQDGVAIKPNTALNAAGNVLAL